MQKRRKKQAEIQPGKEIQATPVSLFGDPVAIVSGAFAALFSATIFISGESITKSGSNAILPILWLLLVICGLFFFARKYREDYRFDRLDVLWIAILGTFLASMLYHFLPGQGSIRYGINHGTAWLGCAGAWPVIRILFDNPQRRKAIFLVLIAVSCSLSIYGSFRHFYETPQNIRAFEADPEAVFAAAGITEGPGSKHRELFENRLRSSTPVATYVLTNTLAGLLAPASVLLLGLLVTSPPKNGNKVLFGLLAIILLFTLVLTQSRSGCIAVAFGIVVLAVLRFGNTAEFRTELKRHLPVLGICAAAFLAGSIFLAFQTGLLDAAKKSLGFRFEYWRASSGMIADNPILGCGPGNFQQYYTQYKLPISSEEILDPHNFLVEIAAISGAPCALLFLALLFFLTAKLFRPNPPGESEIPAPQTVHSSNEIPKSGFEPGTLGILFGGLAGLLLGFFVTQFEEVDIPRKGLFIALISSSACGALLLPWLRSDATISPWVIWTAMLTLLVNLLAAGGITYPNLVVVFWLFTACIAGKPISMKTETKNIADDSRRKNRFPVIIVLTAAFGLASVLAYFYAYKPVMNAGDTLSRARSERYIEDYIKRLHEAGRADPFSPEIQYSLFAAYLNYWDVNSPARENMLKAALDAEAASVRLSPKSASLRYSIARDLLIRYESGGNARGKKELLELAVRRLGEAVELYPNHASSRAAYAVALYRDGNTEDAAKQKQIALELNAEMPHLEQKLDENMLSRLAEIP